MNGAASFPVLLEAFFTLSIPSFSDHFEHV